MKIGINAGGLESSSLKQITDCILQSTTTTG